MTGWSASASIAPGTLRRQSAGGAVFTASQSTTTLTVSAMTSGTIYVGMILSNGNFYQVTALGTGTGGTGTYTVNVSATVGSTTWTGGFDILNPRAFVAVQSATGTTGTTEPSWIITKGAKTTDNTVTWMECTGQAAVNGDLTNTQNWTAVKNTAVALGRIITDNAGTHIFIVFTAGTVGNGSEPSWNVSSVGSTTADNTVTWTYIGTSYSAWAAPSAFFGQVLVTNWAAAGDTIYLGDDHSEQTGSISGGWISPAPPGTAASPNYIYSIDHTLSLPVSSSGLKVGATIGTINSVTLTIAGGSSASNAYFFGIAFNAGSGSGNSSISVCNSSAATYGRFDSCAFKLAATNAVSAISIGGSGTSRVEFNNTTVQFGATTQAVSITPSGKFVWRNTPSAIAGATIPNPLFEVNSAGVAIIEGVDLSAATGTLVPVGTSGSNYGLYQFIDCKLNASATLAGTPVDPAGPFVDFLRCSSAATNYVNRRYLYEGTLLEEITIIRTSGASDGLTGISWKITTTANSKWVLPFESLPITIYNGVTSTNRVVTVSGIWNAAAVPNNDDIWIDVAYFGASDSPLASFQNSTKATNLTTATALTADSSGAWDSIASARQNSHAYSLGDVIKLASNSGRIFFCTTAGTTAGSEPGGYASAVDGGSVTDNTAVFRAGTRFLLTTTLNSPQPQLAGYLRAYVKAAKVSSTFYVDPLIVLS